MAKAVVGIGMSEWNRITDLPIQNLNEFRGTRTYMYTGKVRASVNLN
jgi:hypothetical protein